MGSAVPDPLKDGDLKGIVDEVWTLKAKILTLKDEIWTLKILSNLFLKTNTARCEKIVNP